MKSIPDVRIKYGWLLAGEVAEVLNEKYGDGTPLRSFDEYVAIAERYRNWWQPHNDAVLHGLCDMLDLEFRQNIVDVEVVPWFRPISDPMVVNPGFKTENAFVNTLTHELIHRLLTDNTAVDYEYDFMADWKKLFGKEHDWNTLVHIPVHAVMKQLYLDVLERPDLLEFDVKDVQKYPAYAAAWDYVNAHDYKEIVRQVARVGRVAA